MQFSLIYTAAVLASVASAGNLTTTTVTITSCSEKLCSQTATANVSTTASVTPNITVNSTVESVLQGAAGSMNVKNTGAFLAAGIAAVALIL